MVFNYKLIYAYFFLNDGGELFIKIDPVEAFHTTSYILMVIWLGVYKFNISVKNLTEIPNINFLYHILYQFF